MDRIPLHSQQAHIGWEILILLPLLFILKMQWGSLSSTDTSVGDNACELELPEAINIYLVVSVSQVKKYHGSFQSPPPKEIDGEEEYEVQDILDHRRAGRGYQYLVSWTGYDTSENQCLPEQEL